MSTNRTKRAIRAALLAVGVTASILGICTLLGLPDFTQGLVRVAGITLLGLILLGIWLGARKGIQPSARARARTRDVREDQSPAAEPDQIASILDQHNARARVRSDMIEQVLHFEVLPMATPAGIARALELSRLDDHDLSEAFANAQRMAFIRNQPARPLAANPVPQWTVHRLPEPIPVSEVDEIIYHHPAPESPAFNPAYDGTGEVLQPMAERWMTPGAAESHFGAGEEVVDALVIRDAGLEKVDASRVDWEEGPQRVASNLAADTAATGSDFTQEANQGGEEPRLEVDLGLWGVDPANGADAMAYMIQPNARRPVLSIDRALELAAMDPEVFGTPSAQRALRMGRAAAVQAARTSTADEHWHQRLLAAEDTGAPRATEVRRFLTELDVGAVILPEHAQRLVEQIRNPESVPGAPLLADENVVGSKAVALAQQEFVVERAQLLASAVVHQAGVISKLRGRIVADAANGAAALASARAPTIAAEGDGVDTEWNDKAISPGLNASLRAAGREVARSTLLELGWIYQHGGWTLWDERDGIEPDETQQ